MVPAPPLSLWFGRHAESAALAGELAQGRRLLGIQGGPGAGASRLAARLARDHAQPVAWVDLHSAAAPLPETPDWLPPSGEGLVVLDGIHPEIDGLDGWLDRARGRWRALQWLLTGRWMPAIDGLKVHRLGGLGAEAAQAMLTDRIQARAPAWTLRPEDQAPMATCLARVDHSPLGIEAWARFVPAMQLSELPALGDGALLDAPLDTWGAAHHQSLRACLDLSWKALPPGAQALAGALAQVHARADQATIDALVPPELGDPAGAQQALVDRGLLVAEAGGGWRMPRLWRSHARRLSGTFQRHAAQARHAVHFVQVGAELAARHGLGWRWTVADQCRALLPDLQAALLAAVEQDPGRVAEILLALRPTRMGPRGNAMIHAVRASLDMSRLDDGLAARIHGLCLRVHTLSRQRDRAQAEYQAGLARSRRTPDEAARLEFGWQVAAWRFAERELDQVRAAHQHMIPRADEIGHHQIGLRLRIDASLVATEQARTDSAWEWVAEARRLSEELGDETCLAHAMQLAGQLHFNAGRNAAAIQAFEEALAAFKLVRLAWWRDSVLFRLALARACEDPNRGDGEMKAALAAIGGDERTGWPALQHTELLIWQAHHGRLGRDADQHIADALADAARHDAPLLTLLVQSALVLVEVARDDLSRARALLAPGAQPIDPGVHPDLVQFQALVRATLALAAQPEDPSARAHAQALAQAAAQPRPPDRCPLAEQAGLVSAVRLARSLVDRLAQPRVRLRLAPSCSAFQLDDGPVHNLRRRAAARRILQHLVVQLREGRGATPPTALVGAGWPEERLNPSTGRNRLHVTLAALRKLGLKPWIEHGPEGYRLSDRVTLAALPDQVDP